MNKEVNVESFVQAKLKQLENLQFSIVKRFNIENIEELEDLPEPIYKLYYDLQNIIEDLLETTK
jgi:hypothetical protein